MNPVRAVIIGVAIAGVFFAPFWVPLFLTGILALRYFAWEAILVGVLIDLLYAPHAVFMGVPIPATLVMFVVVFALSGWRKKLAIT